MDQEHMLPDKQTGRWARVLQLLRRGAGRTAQGLSVAGAALLALGRRVLASRWLRRGARLLAGTARVGAAGLLLALLAFGLCRALVHRVPPGYVGIRQARFGSGLVEQDYPSGLVVSPMDRWYHLDGRTQEVRFAWASEGGTQGALPLVTRDGEEVSVAAGVLYSIAEDSAWRLVAAGLGDDYPTRAVAIARRVLSEEFQTMGAEDWFDPAQRADASGRALERLRTEFGASHLEVEEVLVSGVYFRPTFEKKRLERQLDSQGIRTAAALARRRSAELDLEEAQAEIDEAMARLTESWQERLEEVKLEGTGAVREVQLASMRAVAEVEASSEDEYARAVHGGQLALAEAKGLREQLEAEVWAGPGGAEYLAREAARKLTFGKVTLDSSDPRVPNLLDLGSFAGLLIGQ